MFLSGKRDSSPRCSWAILANYIYTPNPWKGREWGRFVANLVFRSKQSLPYQREVWRDCLYGRGLFRETHKKRIALCYPSCVERKTRLEPTLWAIARERYLHPRPLRGEHWVASCERSFTQAQNEKRQLKAVFIVLSGKREFNLCSPIIWSAKILRFLGLLLSFRVTVLAVFWVRILPYYVHLKFLCCNYLCKDNKIS